MFVVKVCKAMFVVKVCIVMFVMGCDKGNVCNPVSTFSNVDYIGLLKDIL